MRLVVRWLRRLAVLALGIVGVWLIAFVFRVTDQRLPTVLALGATYALAAYVVLPRVVRMSVKVLKRRSVPSFTLTGDGLPGDPVNLALLGEFGKLRAVFARAGWTEADTLGLGSSWRMVVAFVLNRPYPAAPFATLYLFGRGQDVGFQKADRRKPAQAPPHPLLGPEPRARRSDAQYPAFWLNTDRPPLDRPALWVGAGTRDTGFSLTRLTFQVTHATDPDANEERDFIVGELKRLGAIGEVRWRRRGRPRRSGPRAPLCDRRRSRSGVAH